MPSTLPMTAKSGGLRRTAGNKGSPSSPSWLSPWEAGIKVQKERSGNSGARLLGTLGNWRVKPFLTSGGDLASSSNGEMLQFWATGFPTSPILKWTELSEILIL